MLSVQNDGQAHDNGKMAGDQGQEPFDLIEQEQEAV